MAQATPDLSEFEKLSKPKRPPCSVGVAIDALSEAESVNLVAALATDNGVITGAAIKQWLDQRGHTMNVQIVASHRKGTCTCRDK